jgi:hypothetical protein
MARINKKRVVAALATTCVLALAAGAYAYFTSTGSGTATATVGSSSAVVLHGTVSGSMYPGGSQTVTLTVDNPGSGAQRVGTVSLTKVQSDGTHSGCVTTIAPTENPAFAMPAVVVNKTYSPGNAQAVTPAGTLTMNDTGLNQDACQGATLTLTLASN